MNNLSLASLQIIMLLLAVIVALQLTVSAELQDGSNDLCYCKNECTDKDQNNSLAFTVRSTFLERAVSKIENLSTKQNEMMAGLNNQVSALEVKMAALYQQQGAAVNSSYDQLNKGNKVSLAQLENQVAVLETKMTALYQQQTASLNASIALMATSLSCPDSWHYDKNTRVCLKLFTERARWDVAKERCENVLSRSRLAVLDTSAKRRVGVKLLRNVTPWIGARRDDGQFKWLDGHEITSGWAPGIPIGNYDCILLHHSSTVYCDGCSYARFYICELPLV